MNKKLIRQIRNEWRFQPMDIHRTADRGVVMWFVVDLWAWWFPTTMFRERLWHLPFLSDQSEQTCHPKQEYNPTRHQLQRWQGGTPQQDTASSGHRGGQSVNGHLTRLWRKQLTAAISYDTIKVGTDDWVMRRLVTPDFVGCSDMRGANGKPRTVGRATEGGQNISVRQSVYWAQHPIDAQLCRQAFKLDIDSTKKYVLGATMKTVKYLDFDSGRKISVWWWHWVKSTITWWMSSA